MRRRIGYAKTAVRDWSLGVKRLASPPSIDVSLVRNAGGQPVVILPGVWERHSAAWRWATTLAEAGFDVHFVPQLDLELGDLDHLGEKLLSWLDQEGLSDSIVVAHSKGGLVAKSALTQNQGAFKGLIACGSPFAGAPIVRATPFSMRLHGLSPTSKQILQLAQNTEVNRKIVVVEAAWDQNVPALRGLPGSMFETVPTSGHNQLLEDPATATKIVAIAEHITRRW